ncbi:hypothetical protein EGR_04817 [Echinococcus granulosus]|uniref:Uncharacterized protein n=1 Tax=Echinococcus granulosus TaxID=6210 RepID=W6V2R4_ECHGR|nr:hypothetical protein EGR_04817 [Echinococcus granulosus]EUB60259.1 hypothetical protein EGR_04817 [Echinococcus granulosus]
MKGIFIENERNESFREHQISCTIIFAFNPMPAYVISVTNAMQLVFDSENPHFTKLVQLSQNVYGKKLTKLFCLSAFFSEPSIPTGRKISYRNPISRLLQLNGYLMHLYPPLFGSCISILTPFFIYDNSICTAIAYIPLELVNNCLLTITPDGKEKIDAAKCIDRGAGCSNSVIYLCMKPKHWTSEKLTFNFITPKQRSNIRMMKTYRWRPSDSGVVKHHIQSNTMNNIRAINQPLLVAMGLHNLFVFLRHLKSFVDVDNPKTEEEYNAPSLKAQMF